MTSSLSIASLQLIDQICLSFEDCWIRGEIPILLEFFQQGEARGSATVESNEESPFEEAPMSRHAAIANSLKTCDFGSSSSSLNKSVAAFQEQLICELLRIDFAYREKLGLSFQSELYEQQLPEFASKIRELVPAAPQAIVTPHRYSAGDRIGRYKIESALGSGAFGAVYLATDEELGRLVAIKYPSDQQLNNHEVVSRLLDEARLAARLDHEGIVRVYDVFRDEHGMPAIVMQFIRGQSLRERINAAPISRKTAIQWVIQVAQAIDFAHQSGVYHRDLEPRNILLDENERPYVSDFGLAIHESVQGVMAGESAGSLAYMSPEQVCGESNWLDGRADIWALGVIMYELLTGRRPFAGRDAAELHREILIREPKPPRQIVRDIPPEIERICLRCLSKDVAARFATAHDLAESLRNAISPAISKRRLRRRVALATMLLVTGAVVALGLILNMTRPDVRQVAPPAAIHTEKAAVDDIQVTAWSQDKSQLRHLGRHLNQATPLRTGELIRVEIMLNKPAHAFVAWLGCEGDVTPVFPGQPGVWGQLCNPDPVQQIGLPAATDQLWPVRAGQSGTESIVVLVSDDRFSPDTNLEQLLSSLAPQLSVPFSAVRWFENGHAILQASQVRSVDVGAVDRVGDPVVTNQTLIAERAAKLGLRVYSLTFPIEK